jgi:hypothetical protein
MKAIITSLMMFFSVIAFAQKPMVGFTPIEIKQRNYLEFSTLYESWNVDEGDGFYMLYTEIPNIDGYVYYYFATGAELNYLSALIMYNLESYIEQVNFVNLICCIIFSLILIIRLLAMYN